MSALTRRNLFKLAGAGAAACALPEPPVVALAAPPAAATSLALAILLCNELKRAMNEHTGHFVSASIQADGGTYTLVVPRATSSEPAHQSQK